MIDAMPSESCSAQKSPTSGRSLAVEQRSPRCVPYSIPSCDSSSSSSSSSRHSIDLSTSRQRPSSHRSLPSFSKLASNSTSTIANKSTSHGPTIARQHAHAAAPLVNSDQDSATRLANTAQNAIRSTAPQSKSVAKLTEAETSPRREFTHVPSNDSSVTTTNSSSPSGSQTGSVTSSLATSVSDSQGLGVSLSGSQSAFKQHQAALQNANGIQTSVTVAYQPPAPPENARGRSVGQAASQGPITSTNQNIGSNQNSNTSEFQQSPPTIEQRDALANRVYAACQAAGYDEWIRLLDLAPLASQHHLSGYNCIKFGQEGSPYAYLPLSLQQPVQVQEVLQKQKINEGKASEWLTEKRRARTRRTAALDERSASQLNSNDANHNKAPRLMSKANENGDVRMRDTSPLPVKKEKCKACQEMAQSSMACECGPLKNEAVLSSEWEAPIGNDACKDPISALKSDQSSTQTNLSVKTSSSHPISISPIIPTELLEEISRHVEKAMPESVRQSKVSLFDVDGIYETRHDDLQVHGKRLIRCRLTRVDMCEIAFKAEREMIEASQAQRKPRPLRLDQPAISEPPPSVMREAMMSDPQQPILVDRGVYCQTSFEETDFEEGGSEHNTFIMGNLLLSSCPGKKVRLTGPVRGRGAICRDLGLDLLRIRQLGVGAIVCCLDDEELSFLGAPWSQYEAEADKLGIEVIRLPMAEGFSPTDVLATDKAISCVVNDYTLHGVHVLVHCRGGVGRAGLIACMWMLKLGLIRSDRDEVRFRVPIESLFCTSTNGHPCHPTVDIMQTVHRLIETIRRRRSPKAIETAEQVDFLVKYLLYLHEQESRFLDNCAKLQAATT